MPSTPVYLCILDGFALGEESEKNAVYDAIQQGRASFIADLFKNHPFARLECSGLAVGLPEGTMGNSEVNHLNMGAGRVVYQSIERINVAIEDGSFFENEALVSAVKNCLRNDSALHLMGILQGHGGTVHGSIKHLFALLELAKRTGLPKAFMHLFTDGRDTNPKAAGEVYLPMLGDEAEKIKTIMGREIAMDRDTAWDKTLTAMKALINGEGEYRASSAREALERSYARGQTDEFIRPTIIGDYKGMGPGDSIVYFNFRQDRTIQLTAAFCESDKRFFDYKKGTRPIDERVYAQIQDLRREIAPVVFTAMTEYYPGLAALTAFPEKEIPDTVGEVVSRMGLKQLRLAGPEKFAHVTGWFSGRRTAPFPGEDRYLAQDLTLKARTENGKRYDLVPEMTAYLETDYALEAIKSGRYSLIVHNFQNGDMVGHTGNLEAAAAAIGHASRCLSNLAPAFIAKGGIFIITADHGNADEMLLKKRDKLVPSTQHSLNPVPFWVLGKEVKLKEKGMVPEVGATVLDLMGLPKPAAMTANSLLISAMGQ
ncbi:2,3-bisphosphoglycerate-independent phosphoglycerate mutase [Candidatus Saganbacteria bacterium]|uniref:2,3-bisphosphoglycerate-independent phosphoglycerate mutase n=1 Tax=Candidatus Saganbacteria bacterium TaxID=2575572 RepID=A0A9D6ULS0_UNCSA|nr:2,3-bisphosphoglycerate-independent phosphoglycerate mutase [Candidatus Saganbacteria bacterium]